MFDILVIFKLTSGVTSIRAILCAILEQKLIKVTEETYFTFTKCAGDLRVQKMH